MSVVPTLHLALRDEAVERIGAGLSVDVQGMPGSGRSQLLRAIADELDDRAHRLIRMRGVAALADRPLEPLAIAGLVGRRDAAAASTAIAAAVAAVGAAAQADGTVFVVDDVDDLDRATAGVLLAAHAEHPFPVLSASTVRPRSTRPAHPLHEALQPGVTLSVPALGYLDLQALLTGRLDGPIDARSTTRIFTASGGLPGVALAIVDGARRAGGFTRTDDVWTAGAELWTADLARTLEPLLRPLSAVALEGLHALALAGTLDATAARELVGWDALEELDGYRLVRFIPRGDDVVVGVFPPVLAERFLQRGLGSRQLKVTERLDAALPAPTAEPAGSGALPSGGRPPDASAPPRRPGGAHAGGVPADGMLADGAPATGASAADAGESAGLDAGPIVNRMLAEHWARLAVRLRAEWEADPNPRTALALLRTLLVTDADAAAVQEVVQGTPRVGDRTAIVDLDAWTALAVGVVEHDLDRAHAVLDRARADAPEWRPLFDAAELHVSLLLGHVPPEDGADDLPAGTHPIAAEAWAVARAERLLALGRPAEALVLLEGHDRGDSSFAHLGSTLHGLALLVDGRLDEAMEWAAARLAEARADGDVDGIVAHAYTVAVVLLLRLRLTELRTLLASVLSSGVVSTLQRPAQAGLISIAAIMALEEGQTDSARNLAGQAVAMSFGPDWYPTASPGYALARVAGADTASLAGLWAEHRELVARGCSLAALVTGVLAAAEQPDPHRSAEVLALARRLPAPAARWLERYLEALVAEEPDAATRGADALVDAGVPFFAMGAYRRSIAHFSERGALARAASVAAAARVRLDATGPDAGAALGRPAAQSLTDRESEVARLAADGLSNQQIADRLHLSVRTVENHLHRAFRKLGVDSRASLADALAG